MTPQELEEFWLRENSITHILTEVKQLNTHFEDLEGNTFIINAVIFPPTNTAQSDEPIAEWVLTGAGSPHQEDKNYTQSSRVLKAAITAIKREMQLIAAEMIIENREKIQKNK